MIDRAAQETNEEAVQEAEEAAQEAQEVEKAEKTEEAAQGAANEEAGEEAAQGASGRIRAGEDAECGSFTRMNLRYGTGMGNTGSPSQRGQFRETGGRHGPRRWCPVGL